MAALVSHAMRRYPLSPSDGLFSSCNNIGSENSSWHKEECESSLSRSMRYADPWLYGSVKAPIGPIVLAPAFVLCSCQEYLQGTKRTLKNGPVSCKKCKGTRVPLSPTKESKYGTVRCYSTVTQASNTSGAHAVPPKAGTVRVNATSRPSILPKTDPYDLMRRSRLSVPISEGSSQLRTRSVSPNKNKLIENRRFSATRADTSSVSSSISRRSILECDINPYELMSTDPEIGTASSSTDASITLVNGQRIRVRPPPYDPDVYDDVGESKESNLLTSPFEINNLIDQQNQKGVNKIKRSIEKQTASKKTCDTQRDLKQTLRCKSILKKRCNSYTEPDFQGSLAKRNDISLRRKSGSHFYLPLPRKKVQFLVEHHLENASTYEFPSENVLSPCNVGEITPNSNEKETTIINYENISSENIKQNEDEPYQEVNVQLENNKMLSRNESNVQTCNLRRSTSERINQEQAKVVFFDTMALRVKPPKNDARELFSINDLERLDGVEKSRKINAKKMSVHKNFTTNQILKSCTTDENNENCNMKAFEKVVAKQQSRNMEVFINQVVKLKEQCECIEVNEKKTCDPNSSIITHLETKNDLSEKINVKLERTINSMIITDSPPLAPPRKRSNGKQPLINKNDGNKTNYESFSNITLDESVDKIFSLNILTNDIKSPPVDEQNVKMDFQNQFLTSEMYSNVSISEEKPNNLNKTIVQLTSSSTSPVHKVQIKNEFPDPSNIQRISVLENPQRKTSILITGDDCYSTVNVNDDVPLYQSSVVVKDQNDICIPIINKKSSSIYITGSFVNNDLGNFNFEKSSKDQSIANTIDTSNAFNFTKDIHKDYTPLSEKDRPSTPEMLRQLLRDPVEAVKLNLVPHVCGKSGTPKRPRDKKINKYYPMFSVNTSVLENIGYKKHSLEDIPKPKNVENCMADDQCSEHSSSTQYEFVDPGSDCYTDHSNRSSVTEEELNNRTKFYELLADSALIEIENEDHHYESINKEPDPIYEEIEIPPPLPANPPPCNLLDDLKLDKEFTTRSIFEGASKYDILSYLVDAKERGIIPEDSYTFSNIIGESNKELVSRESHISNISDSSEDNSLIITGALIDEKAIYPKSTDIERNDSGVGSETSKTSVSKYRIKPEATAICEDCDSSLDLEIENEPLLCRKCTKKRSERKEIIMEIVETEEKYSKDLQIILEEFYQPMLVAGLLTPEQLSAIFLNVEELLDNSQALAEKLRDAVEIAFENGDEDLLTVNMGKLFLESTPMLHAFETYCIRQGPASLLLAGLEKEKELLRIFLKVSQMENTLLRRMNLNSFLMVPVQRVTKYPLLLARLYKVTPSHHETREQLKEAQHKIELHLNHMNSETKDIPSKLWRRIGSSSGRRSSSEMDLVNIKLRKIAVDVLEWNHEEAKFALEGKLLFTQPADNNWRKGRTIKLSPVNALLVINGKVHNGKSERDENTLVFPKHAAVREAALLLVRDKNGRYSLLRDPLYLDRCVIAADPSWQSYFEVQELLSKDTFIFKAEDEHQTKIWYQQLQFHAQGMGAWRKRRNALANIMMNGMGLRS